MLMRVLLLPTQAHANEPRDHLIGYIVALCLFDLPKDDFSLAGNLETVCPQKSYKIAVSPLHLLLGHLLL